MKRLEDIYTAEWFHHDFQGLRGEFAMAADGVWREFAPVRVLDVGCGPAFLLERLQKRGAQVLGVEGSKHGIDYASEEVRARLHHIDLRTANALPAFEDPLEAERAALGRSSGKTDRWAITADVVVCTEVLEHVEPEYAAHVVQLLADAADVGVPIVVTAAPPGQDGHHHVNCQPPEYWDRRFARWGLAPDFEATARMRLRWSALERLSHMTRNVRVYR